MCALRTVLQCASKEGDSAVGVTCLRTLCTKVASYIIIIIIIIRVEPHNVEFFEMRDV